MSPADADEVLSSGQDTPLLRVEDLQVHFPVRGSVFGHHGQTVKAVDGVSFEIGRGRTLGLVGESGCGKSTLARAILRLIPATAGRVRFDGRDVFAMSAGEMQTLRRQMQIVFQDPLGSLNPRMTVEMIVGEALSVHGMVKHARQRRERVTDLLTRVGLSPDALGRYPHEFSGGQRQRIGIARALALEPKFVVCDEPVSALDVSIQSQILNLLGDLQRDLGLSYLLIAHNLAVVRHCSDEVAVMYLGRIVEYAPAGELYTNPAHPYTQALLAAAPNLEVRSVGRATEQDRQLQVLPGEPPNPLDPPTGCPFHPRCRFAEPCCRQAWPRLEPRPGFPAEHRAACHLAGRPDHRQRADRSRSSALSQGE